MSMTEFSPTILSIVTDGNSGVTADLLFGKESCGLSISSAIFAIDKPRSSIEIICPCIEHNQRACEHSVVVAGLLASLSDCIDAALGSSTALRKKLVQDLSQLDDIRRDIISFHMELNADSFTSDTEASLHRQSFIHRLQSLLTKFYTLEARNDPPITLLWSDHKDKSPTLFSEDIANLAIVRNFMESGCPPEEPKVTHAFLISLSKMKAGTASAYLSLAGLLSTLGRPTWARELISRSSAMAREGLADYGLTPEFVSRLRNCFPSELAVLVDRKLPFFKKLEISENEEKPAKINPFDSTLAELRALREQRINQRVRERIKNAPALPVVAVQTVQPVQPVLPVQPVQSVQSVLPVQTVQPVQAVHHQSRGAIGVPRHVLPQPVPRLKPEIPRNFQDENVDWAELDEWERQVREDLDKLE